MRTFAVKILLVAATTSAIHWAPGTLSDAWGQTANTAKGFSDDSDLQPARSFQDSETTADPTANRARNSFGFGDVQQGTNSDRTAVGGNVPAFGTGRTRANGTTTNSALSQPRVQDRSNQVPDTVNRSYQQPNGVNRSGLTMTDNAAISTNPQPKISVDFPGGTIGEYVDTVKKAADSLNLIVTESAKELKLPKIALKNVPVHVAVKCIEQCFDPSKTIVRVGGEVEGVQFIQAEIVATNQVEVINIRHLISGSKDDKEKENFLAAVETGLQMQSETTKNLKIKFHEETGLLFLSGDRSEISLVQHIVSELSPRYAGGMPSGMGAGMGGGSGMMGGSGGFGMGAPGMTGYPSGSMGGGAMSGGGGMLPGAGSGSMMPGGGGGSGAAMMPGDSGGSGIGPNRTRRGSFPNSGGSGQLDRSRRPRGSVPGGSVPGAAGGTYNGTPEGWAPGSGSASGGFGSGGSASGGSASGKSSGLGGASFGADGSRGAAVGGGNVFGGGDGSGVGSSSSGKNSKPKSATRKKSSKSSTGAGGSGYPGFPPRSKNKNSGAEGASDDGGSAEAGGDASDRAGAFPGDSSNNESTIAEEAAAAFETDDRVGN